MVRTIKPIHDSLFSTMLNEYLLSIVDYNKYELNYINTRNYIRNNMNRDFFKEKVKRNCEEITKTTPNYNILTMENTIISRGKRLDKFKETYTPILEKYLVNASPIMTDDYMEKVAYLVLLFNTVEFGLKYSSLFDEKGEILIHDDNLELIKNSHIELIDTIKFLVNYFE